jgi:CheY-like chemotaxis protein
MSILFLTADLMFSSRVSGAARTVERSLTTVASTAALLDQAAHAEAPRLVILDLTTPGCDPDRIVVELRDRDPDLTVVAYAPHVQTALLQRAREAGCDQVLTRGQFDSRINDLVSGS